MAGSGRLAFRRRALGTAILTISGSRALARLYAFFANGRGGREDLLRQYGTFEFSLKFEWLTSHFQGIEGVVQDLELDHLWVVHPGRERYPLDERITALPLRDANQILSNVKQN